MLGRLIAPIKEYATAIKWGLLAVLVVGAWVGGCTNERTKWKAKEIASESLADVRVEGLKRELELSKESGKQAVALVSDVLNAQLDGLRNRPMRRVEVIRGGACTGVTGAELSRPDGEFLEREAARAQRILIERDKVIQDFNSLLAACKRQ